MSRVFRAQSRPQRALPAVSKARVPAEVPSLPDPAALVAAAKEEAETVVASAIEEAAALVERSRAEAERVATEAREAGHNDGYLDGHAKGLAEAESLAKEARLALETARTAYSGMLKEAEPRLLALVMEVSRRVVTDSFAADSQMVLDLIRKGLDALRDEREFSLRVDPALVALIEGQAEVLGKEYGAKSIDVVGDPDVSGGAVILTPHGYVDVTIESQIRNISLALAEARKRAMGTELQ